MFEIHNFRVGDRVQLHPATDLWMRGARFGVVTRIGRLWLTVRLDRRPRPVTVAPRNIGEILD